MGIKLFFFFEKEGIKLFISLKFKMEEKITVLSSVLFIYRVNLILLHPVTF